MVARIYLEETENTLPYANLAREACLLEAVEPGECILYLWQNQRTVVIGRNQNAWKECRVRQLEVDGGHLVRRLSGGGAVYHDLGNLNFTFLVREEEYDVSRQLQVLVEAVNRLGIHAEKTGRNDVTVDGRKISGNAFYRVDGHCCHHGTVLIDVDKSSLSAYLNVSTAKLQSKGVDSVKARVANLTDFCPGVTVGQVRQALAEAFGEVYGLSPERFPEKRLDQATLAQKEEHFRSWDWRFGRNIPFTNEFSGRFGWGEVCLQFEVSGGTVADVQVYSDAMDQDLVAALPGLLKGCRYGAASLSEAVGRLSQTDSAAKQILHDLQKLFAEQCTG